MSLTNLSKFPAPWYGGKTDAAPAVWEALGDVAHYCEPFAGSCAVLLLRPHECNRVYFSETVNDADGLLVNAIRSIQLHPDATAEAASCNVTEADVMARHFACLKWKTERDVEKLMADPAFCDPVIAGYWLFGVSSWIGSGWCSGAGPWVVGADGRITKRTGDGGVHRKLPHLSDDGRGVNRPQTREPGVHRKLPHLTSDGVGVNRPQTREPGVARQLPHLTDDGQGVNRPQTREPGVSCGTPDRPWEIEDFHPQTMPELRRWFAFLSARLRHVRILNGDWTRAVTNGASHPLSVRQGGIAGYFADPPYADTADRTDGLYSSDSLTVAHDVREWALRAGTDPQNRIVVAGFEGEHGSAFTDAGWREVEWFKDGYLTGGMANQSADGHQQARERLWLSPHCAKPAVTQPGLFDALEGK